MHVRTTSCSFIIVNWNARAFLIEAIESIYREWGRDDAEVIVVDNASHDDSVAVLADRFPKVTLIANSHNLGFAAGNNLGITAASGDVLFFVNVDAALLPGSLDAMIDFMDAHPDVGVMGPRVLNTDRTLQRSARRRPTLARSLGRALALDNLIPSLAFHAHTTTEDVDVLSGCFWVVRRSALVEVGPLDDGFFMYGEDLDWSRRFAEAGWRVVYFADAEVVHHGGQSSVHAPVRFFVEMRKADLRYWRKHHGVGVMLIYGLILVLHHTIRLVAGLVQQAIPGRRAGAKAKVARSSAVIRWLFQSRFGLKPVQVPA